MNEITFTPYRVRPIEPWGNEWAFHPNKLWSLGRRKYRERARFYRKLDRIIKGTRLEATAKRVNNNKRR